MKAKPFLRTKKALSVFIEYTTFKEIPINTVFFDVDEAKWKKVDHQTAIRIGREGGAYAGGLFYSHVPVTVLTTTSPSG